MSDETKIRFEEAVERSKSLPKQPPAVMLDMYGLFKQATSGDASGKRPGAFDIRGRAKYDAWSSRKGMAAETAMTEYVAYVEKLAAQS